MKLNKAELKEFLDEKVDLYNQPAFIESDPISIPHQFTKKQDIEIAVIGNVKYSEIGNVTAVKMATRLQ